MTYHAISVQTELNRRREAAAKKRSNRRRTALKALDALLEQLEQLNLRDRAIVPAPLARRLITAGVRHRPPVSVPDLIERVFARQERYMLMPPKRPHRVPTLEELEDYFRRETAKVA